MNRAVQQLGREYGIDARIAYDGDQLILPEAPDVVEAKHA